MLICLSGPDSYRRAQGLKTITEEFMKKHPDATVARFDFREEPREEFAKLKGFAASQTLFDTTKLGVVTGLFSEGTLGKTAECRKMLQSVADKAHVTLVLDEEKALEKEIEPFKIPEKLVKRFECLEGAAWTRFLEKEAKARGLEIAAPAVPFMRELFQEDTWALMQELEKLSLLGVSSVDLAVCGAVGMTRETDFMQLLRGVLFGSLPQKLKSLEGLYARKEDSAKIFNVGAYQNRDMLSHFAEYDVAVKSGKLGYEEAILDMVL